MKVTQEKLSDSQLGLEIEISGESSRKKYDQVVKELSRSTTIPGFRKGKVPIPILLQKLGIERIKAAVLEELLQESMKAAIEQENIEPLEKGKYQLRSDFEELLKSYKPGEVFSFSAAVEMPPEIELGDYHNLKVKAEEIKYNPEDVEEFLTERRAAQSILVPVEERSAQIGDLAVIDFQGKETAPEGETAKVIPGVEGNDFEMELAVEKFIPGFVEGIVGMNIGESKTIPLTFPEDYPTQELAGKPVVFEITLKELKERELPELDDEFAQEVSEFQTMAEFRESVEKQYQEKAEQDTKNGIEAAILAELVAISKIEIPGSLIDEEVSEMLTQTAMQFQQMGMDVKQVFTQESIPKMRENIRPEAKEKLQENLAIKEIAKKESIKPEEEAIAARIAEIKLQLEGQAIDEERLLQIVVDELTREKTLSWLQEKAQVELLPQGSLSESNPAEEETGDNTEEPEAQNQNPTEEGA